MLKNVEEWKIDSLKTLPSWDFDFCQWRSAPYSNVSSFFFAACSRSNTYHRCNVFKCLKLGKSSKIWESHSVIQNRTPQNHQDEMRFNFVIFTCFWEIVLDISCGGSIPTLIPRESAGWYWSYGNCFPPNPPNPSKKSTKSKELHWRRQHFHIGWHLTWQCGW